LRRLLLATTNPGKLAESRDLLAGLPVELLTLADLPPVDPPEETGRTFAENARLKATYYASTAGLPAVAEDSGLEVDALGGAPGVESARYAGASTGYPEKFARLAEALAASGSDDRAARFVCALALVDQGRVVFETTGTIEGLIASEPRGTGGFGYDPIFFYPPLGMTLAEAGRRKAEVSHRAQAFRRLRTYLEHTS
jgi:XTP/dITP diphosphohydrolase